MSISPIIKSLIVALLLSLTAMSGAVLADGTETLGPPNNINLATGSGIVTAGVGMLNQATGMIYIDVPGAVQQALLYWVCESDDANGDDTILLNSVQVTGNKIGGATQLGSMALWTETYRADVTTMITPGVNQLIIEGMDCIRSTGAGLLVIYDDGTGGSEIQIRDGSDFAFCRYDGNLHVTVPQTFQFAGDTADRTANLLLFVSSIEAPSPPDIFRRNSIEITIDGITEKISNALLDSDGHEWDTFIYPVTIPAGVGSMTVQIFSRDDDVANPESYCPPADDPNRPASLVWVGAGLSMQQVPFYGCTPGYWKQEQHFNSWFIFKSDELFEDVFGRPITIDWSERGKPQPVAQPTLLQALEANGGGMNALARHAVAALLSASNPYVSYPKNTSQVIDMVNSAIAQGNIDEVKEMLAGWNEENCPVNGSEPNPAEATTLSSGLVTKLDVEGSEVVKSSQGDANACFISALFY